MTGAPPGSAEVDAYIAAAPRAAQPHLRRLRAIIRQAAPQAEERISYRMPYYHHLGRLIYFAAHTNHVGLYALGRTDEAAGLQKYATAKGTLRFRFDQPLPQGQIAALVRKRVSENESAAAAKSRRTAPASRLSRKSR